MSGISDRQEYWPFLDGLRGLAILIVIPHNINAFNGAKEFEQIPAIVSHAGWIGVQIFFVLSGFLITNQLLRDQGATNYFSSFYMRRVLRIFPLYYLALGFGLFFVPHFMTLPPDKLESFSHAPWLWVFLNNWTQPFSGSVYLFSHFWSLAVEEQFYLLWPVVVMWCARGARLLQVCIILVLIALLCRYFTVCMHMSEYAAYMLTVCRMDALAIGAAAAWVRPQVRQCLSNPKTATLAWWVCIGSLAGCALLSGVFDTGDPFTITAGYPLLAVITAGMILVCSESKGAALPAVTRALLSVSALRSVGRYSFAMYVIHFPLLQLAEQPIRSAFAAIGLPGAFVFVIGFTSVTYLLGIASYMLLERHFLSLKTYFAIRRVPTARDKKAAHALPADCDC